VPVTRHLELRQGAYRDSVTLMQVSRAVADQPGVTAALVAMATDLNLDLLGGMGFDRPDGATPDDLLVAVDAADDEALAGALRRCAEALAERAPASDDLRGAPAPRTLATAARTARADLALVSTPGRVAFADAVDALEAGLSVMLFSDNVPVTQEVWLKEEAARRGLLVMGPDCGTAVVSGVGLGFANVVRPGPVGLVAASGTGAQQVMSLLDGAGVGTSHCLGVGGRDLSAAVGGRSTHAALDLLDADAATELVVVVSKPPDADVARAVRAHAERLHTPVLLALLGAGNPDLTESARRAVEAVGGSWTEPRWWPAPEERRGHYPTVRGLFAGGTLCEEAAVLAGSGLRGPVLSNVTHDPAPALDDDLDARGGHAMVDFGDDRLTRGRPHPMIDQGLRAERLLLEAADPTAGVLLLDVVLGHAAHPDPAAELAPAIRAAHERATADGREVAVVVSLVGTSGDPQGLERQATALAAAGASVHLSNAAAARKAVELCTEAS
jgi:succinyl-CoA synthetase alpha subunit